MLTALIPARLGSKRIPGKNIKKFFGKPLIEWTVSAAKSSEIFDKIIISTNDNMIAEMYSKSSAVTLLWRSDNISMDNTPMTSVINDFLAHTNLANNFCVLQPTSPLRNSQHVIEAYKLFQKYGRSIVSARILDHPIEWSFQLNEDGEIPNRFVDSLKNKRSQDFKKSYELNGAMYFYKIKEYLKYKSQIIPNSKVYEMNFLESIDIDTEQDFKMAELIAKNFMVSN